MRKMWKKEGKNSLFVFPFIFCFPCEKNLLLFYKRGHKRNLFGSCGSGFKKDDLRKDFPEKIFLYKQKISRLVTNGVSKY